VTSTKIVLNNRPPTPLATSFTGEKKNSLRISLKKMPFKSQKEREEEEFLNEIQQTPKTPTERKRKSPAVVLSDIFDVIIEKVKLMPGSIPFLKPVNIRDAPDYYTIIQHPMDINKIKDKIKAFKYTGRQDFEDDWILIRDNCIAYNQSKPQNAHLISYIQQIYATVKQELDDKNQEIQKCLIL